MWKKSQNIMLLIGIIWLTAACAGNVGQTRNEPPEPTAIVVDEITGEPIEGAVGLVVWWRAKQLNWFEGIGAVVPVAAKVVQALSDEQGRIFIPEYWKSGKGVLSVYKCGYTCWNQHRIFMKGKPENFNKNNRIVRMHRWSENYSYIRHEDHIFNNIARYYVGGLFDEKFDECEAQKYVDEMAELRRKRVLERSKSKSHNK